MKVLQMTLLFILIAVLTTTTGCMSSMCAAIINVPTYEETVAAWPSLDEGEGRVVFYTPGSVFDGSMISVKMDDEKLAANVGDGFFVFFDVKSGLHKFHYFTRSGLIHKKDNQEIPVQDQEIAYVKLASGFAHITAEYLPEEKAVLELKKLKHNFKKILPANEQPRKTIRVW